MLARGCHIKRTDKEFIEYIKLSYLYHLILLFLRYIWYTSIYSFILQKYYIYYIAFLLRIFFSNIV